MKRFLASTIISLCALSHAHAGSIPKDPWQSPMWEYLAAETFGKTADIRVDERIKIYAPLNAESNFTVPVSVDASGIKGVEEIVLLTDLNPFPIAARFYPKSAKAYFATQVKLNEGSVIHAVAKLPDGSWAMSGTFVWAQGGGCAAPSVQMASSDWSDHLLEVQAKVWPTDDNHNRLRLRIRHPMDTGLSGNVATFILEEVNVYDAEENLLTRFEPKEPISEDPIFTFELPKTTGNLRITGRDNNGNEFDVKVATQ
ncbi:quinoprotein dehydrogenase-associated SoxYZ-like carrier [Terasakiella sp. SH-1]|uniref:quinoprotein dehydrogenase-associated SoxYZ-like carrier n=1 Tax=Terasakiella sp. SH-1 TaxID=2560057 RepID=UPI0010734A65|nr:quinoprotein dehydrogenase-associated SoxYZ-like carrier [Terasakiella sp. SH-1]